MKWNATLIIVAFFNPHEQNKIVSTNFYKILLHQIALFGLANWTKKVFLFSRVTYHSRRDQKANLNVIIFEVFGMYQSNW